MISFKYSILTFIIGKNYEIVHEITNKQDNVEYILVTDDEMLCSNTWKVVYDETLKQYNTPFERCFSIRYNVFKYCSTDICITIDGSMEVKGSLDKLIDKFNDEKYDICLMPHPLWPDFITEYNAWIKMRNYPIKLANKFFKFLSLANYDIKYKGLFQLCFSIKRKTETTNVIDSMTMSILKWLSLGEESFERLDQTVFSYVMNRYFNTLNVLPISEQVVRSYAIQWYWHKSMNKNMNVFYDIDKPDIKWIFNNQVECLYLK